MMPNIRIPSMTRAVMTGRRIKSSATFMLSLALGTWSGGRGRGSLRSAGSRSGRLFELYLGDSRHQPQLPVGHDLFTRRQAFRDDGLSVGGAIDSHLARLNRHVRFDHENKLS